jgi:hypothetical protein
VQCFKFVQCLCGGAVFGQVIEAVLQLGDLRAKVSVFLDQFDVGLSTLAHGEEFRTISGAR